MLGDDAIRATNRATKLREPRRTDSVSESLNKQHKRQRKTSRRYRTQEVSGSSPASSIYDLQGFLGGSQGSPFWCNPYATRRLVRDDFYSVARGSLRCAKY